MLGIKAWLQANPKVAAAAVALVVAVIEALTGLVIPGASPV